MENIIDIIDEYKRLADEFKEKIYEITPISAIVLNSIKNGNKILICGNGGSAAESQHFAAELVARFERERKAIPAIALSTDTSIITAMANDYSFEDIFSRQVDALGNKGDILFGFTTSGNSKNIIKAFQLAKNKGIITIAITGKGGKILEYSDYIFRVNSSSTARIQEIHLLFIHILCRLLEKEL